MFLLWLATVTLNINVGVIITTSCYYIMTTCYIVPMVKPRKVKMTEVEICNILSTAWLRCSQLLVLMSRAMAVHRTASYYRASL